MLLAASALYCVELDRCGWKTKLARGKWMRGIKAYQYDIESSIHVAYIHAMPQDPPCQTLVTMRACCDQSVDKIDNPSMTAVLCMLPEVVESQLSDPHLCTDSVCPPYTTISSPNEKVARSPHASVSSRTQGFHWAFRRCNVQLEYASQKTGSGYECILTWSTFHVGQLITRHLVGPRVG